MLVLLVLVGWIIPADLLTVVARRCRRTFRTRRTVPVQCLCTMERLRRIGPGAMVAIVATLGAVALGACGGTGDSSGAARQQLTVSAAASLKRAFTAYGDDFATASARFSFAGSDELAAQIEQGVRPDVYAAANTKLPDELYAKG